MQLKCKGGISSHLKHPTEGLDKLKIKKKHQLKNKVKVKIQKKVEISNMDPEWYFLSVCSLKWGNKFYLEIKKTSIEN